MSEGHNSELHDCWEKTVLQTRSPGLFITSAKNPLVQEKIVQEVRQVIIGPSGEIDVDNIAEHITDETMDKMHYLHAALTETLRLYPGVPVDGRAAETDDILPDGYRVKKGDNVYYLSFTMGRMPYIWGDDAEEFRPERWLGDYGVFQPESPFKFVAFHAGPRICLGKRLCLPANEDCFSSSPPPFPI
ncbi:hypothetical protein Ancab_037757 [Ancistrocladus abbreviatus]